MKTAERIEALHNLGIYLKTIDVNELESLIDRARAQNPWFTPDNIRLGVTGLIRYLDKTALERWVSAGQSPQSAVRGPQPMVHDQFKAREKKVGIVMAGNIPFVGFHDLLAVLVTGNVALVKLSSKDAVLIPYLVERLAALEPRFKTQVVFVEQLKDFDAVIATGSDNSARYFEYYFGKYPHVIRKNRTSCAILRGDESREEFQQLGHDVFSYFGLGCRNVSKLYVPTGYDFRTMFESWEGFTDIIHHHKYHNNYDYQKSILLVNRIHHLDNGFVMVTETDRLVSPISVIYFEYYKNDANLDEKLTLNADKIQCIVGRAAPATVSFGQAQYPALWDYADQIDILKFSYDLK